MRTQISDIEKEFPYVVVLVSGEKHPEEIPDSIFYKKARGITFPVNIFKLPKNDSWFDELRDEVYPWARKNKLELRYIEMRGASSPEGPLNWNDVLAKNRSHALIDTLQSIFHVDYSLVDSSVVSRPEDYKALLYMMKQNNDPQYAFVNKLLNRHKGNRATEKAELMKVDRGRLWQRLLKQYYPAIRYARVILFFAPQATPAPEGVKINRDTPDEMGSFEIRQPEEEQHASLIKPRKHVLAVRTNLVYDFFYYPKYGMAYSPNIQLEYYPNSGRFSFNASLTYPDWESYWTYKFWQIHDYNLGVRYYTRKNKVTPKDATQYYDETADFFQGFYIGAYGNIGRYGIGLDDKTGWEGEYVGGGLQVGYTMPLCRSSRWRLEFSVGIGVLASKYDPYIWGNPINGEKDGLYYYEWYQSAELFRKRNHHFLYFGPTEVGIHLTYDILYRRGGGKKGVSVYRWGVLE